MAVDNIEKAIVSKLVGTSAVNNLISGRIYPLQLPQTPTLPAITFQRVDGPREHHFEGASGIAHPRIQIDTYARTYPEVVELAKQVRIALDGFDGAVGTVNIKGAWLRGDHDMDDGLSDELVVDQYRRTLDFVIWHDE